MGALRMELVIALCIAGLGAAGAGWSLFEIGAAYASRHWPRTLGTIVSSSVQRESDDEGGNSYSASIRYTYSVNGTAYTSKRVRFGGSFSWGWRSPAQALQRRYPLQSPVEVHYDPEDPSRSVLEAGNALPAWVVLLFCVAVVAADVAMVYYGG